MLVKFKNAEVELYKVRKGVVVLIGGHIGHISKIDFPEIDSFCVGVLRVDVESVDCDHFAMSTDIEWIEPH